MKVYVNAMAAGAVALGVFAFVSLIISVVDLFGLEFELLMRVRAVESFVNVENDAD